MKSEQGLTIADYIELDEDEFDVNEAIQFVVDIRAEMALFIENIRMLDKLENRIKKHIKDTGEMPDVDGAKIKVIHKKEQLRIKRGKLPELYKYLTSLDIENLDDYFHEVKPPPSISLQVE
jgi:hypothetical protein